MRQKFTHLTLQERIQIEKYFDKEFSASSIAILLGRNKATISRELKNTHYNSYLAYNAHMKAARIRFDKNYGRSKIQDNKQLYKFVVSHLRKKWSPEQISLHLEKKYPNN